MGSDAQPAMNCVRWVHKDGNSARACQSLSYFLRDDAGLTHAGDDDLAVAAGYKLNGGRNSFKFYLRGRALDGRSLEAQYLEGSLMEWGGLLFFAGQTITLREAA